PDEEKWAQEFGEAGPPDLENPDTDLAYVRKLQLIVLRQISRTPNPSKEQQAAWRGIREMSAVVGMTWNRSKLEAELRALKQALSKYQEQGGAIKIVKGGAVARPSTARGRKRAPRPPENQAPQA